MKATLLRYAKDQSGYTLVELIVASAIGLFVMTGLTSMVLTTYQAGTTATSRIEASSQIRNFQFEAYDDFSLSNLPLPNGCAGTAASPCTTPIALQGMQASNSTNPITSAYQVTYTWDMPNRLLMRQVNGNPAVEAANSVTAFSWYLDGSGSHQMVVVTISVKVQSYTETQVLRFYPRVNP
jgi:prepilin-type N-terminal cleavage/methylation domain-containing protein